MRNSLKAAIAAAGILSGVAAPALGNANVIYFLVGSRHVYRLGPSPYNNVQARKDIEQTYADSVADAQAAFNRRIDQGEDAAYASSFLNRQLANAALARDTALSDYFPEDDEILYDHPELVLQGDGPYQVIGINIENDVWSNYVVYAPWPGYVCVDRPYGWVYGRPYDPYAFHAAYVSWYGGWVSAGAPLFVGLYGQSGYMNVNFSVSITQSIRSNGFEPGPGFRPGPSWHSSFQPPSTLGGRPIFSGGNGGRPPTYGGGNRPPTTTGGVGNRQPVYSGGSFGNKPPTSTGPGYGPHEPIEVGTKPPLTPGGGVGNRPPTTIGGLGNRPPSTTGGSLGNRPPSTSGGTFGSRSPISFGGTTSHGSTSGTRSGLFGSSRGSSHSSSGISSHSTSSRSGGSFSSPSHSSHQSSSHSSSSHEGSSHEGSSHSSSGHSGGSRDRSRD